MTIMKKKKKKTIPVFYVFVVASIVGSLLPLTLYMQLDSLATTITSDRMIKSSSNNKFRPGAGSTKKPVKTVAVAPAVVAPGSSIVDIAKKAAEIAASDDIVASKLKRKRNQAGGHKNDNENDDGTILIPEVAIFYNVFIPPNDYNVTIEMDGQHEGETVGNCDAKTALSIIQEQLTMRSESSISKESLLFYTQIGNIDISIQEMCEPNCVPLVKIPEGDEMITLQALHQYCIRHPNHRVIYIHTKGTYHHSEKNTRLRQLLTKGAFSDACVKRPANHSCNVCSTQFDASPFHHTPGNIFHADCNYVQRLIPPIDFPQQKLRIYQLALDDKVNHTAPDFMYKRKKVFWQMERLPWIGTGRYAMEHWIYSHPFVVPCDVRRETRFHYGRLLGPFNNSAWVPRLELFPTKERKIMQTEIAQHKWFRLPGRLYEWDHLYGLQPKNDSWVWPYYAKG